MSKSIDSSYEVKANTIIANMKKRNITGYYCKTKADALKKSLELIDRDKLVSWGGGVTLSEINLLSTLRNEKYNVLDRASAKDSDEAYEIMRNSLLSDIFLMSSNAITMDGKLVNIDGNANRVAALCFGPKKVIVIAGMNKVVVDEESAIKRIKQDAACPNAIRLGLKTPCSVNGVCSDCLNNTICCQTVITRKSRHDDRIHVILVGENLGY